MRYFRYLLAPAQTTGIKADQVHINQVQKDLMRKADNWNRERVIQLKNIRGRNMLTGLALAVGVGSIYAYSIFAIRQESFLDDLKEPELED